MIEEIEEDYCIWDEVNEYDDVHWNTGCGQEFILLDGTPETNGMIYCPFCGSKILMTINDGDSL